MYEFPHGGEQQLNLNWIINEIITLHKRLDPDWELPQFDTAFPYTNLNTLNLDWILRELKAIKDLAPSEDAQLLKMVANALIANTYDATTQYNVDDIVYRDNDNRLYKCITATPAGGEPFDSAKWVEIDVGGVLTDLLTNQTAPVEPYDSNPAMDGTASAGTSTQYARGDHVHPKDTARVPTSRTVNGKALSSNITLNASDIPNDSNVTGDNTDDALNNLDTAISNESTARANTDTAIESGIAIVANGNVHYAVLSGQFVYVKNHQTLTDGLYIATATIPTNQPLTTSNTTPASSASGALNALQNESATGYCKMPDGTAIIWGNVSGLTFSNESIKEGSITLPFALVSGNVHATPYNTSNQTYMFFCGASLVGGAGTTVNWTLATITGSAISISNRGFAWLAVGRWK